MFNREMSGGEMQRKGGTRLLWRDGDTVVSRVLILSAFIAATGLAHAAPHTFLQIKL